MEISPGGQFASFLAAAATGCALGVIYDALAALARKLRMALIRALFDALFWVAVLLALTWYAFAVGGGELRIYALAGALLGAVVYFAALSRASRRLLDAALGAVFWLLGLCCAPFAAFFGIINKFCRFLSNLFHFMKKRDILYYSAADVPKIRARAYKRGDGLEEVKEAAAFHHYRNRNLLRLRRDQFDKPPKPDKRTESDKGQIRSGPESRAERQRRFTSSYRV